MFKILLLPVGLAIALFGAGLTLGAGPRDAVRSDCPGKIICPKTGREICKDKCPLNDENKDKDATPPCCK